MPPRRHTYPGRVLVRTLIVCIAVCSRHGTTALMGAVPRWYRHLVILLCLHVA